MVLLCMQMSSSSIPVGLSSFELEKVLETEKPDEEIKVEMTGKEMRKLVSEEVEILTDKFGTIFGYKCVAMYCIQMMKAYHDSAATDQMKNEEFDSALNWARDAGKLQAAFSDVLEVNCGPQDFTFDDSDED